MRDSAEDIRKGLLEQAEEKKKKREEKLKQVQQMRETREKAKIDKVKKLMQVCIGWKLFCNDFTYHLQLTI